TPIPPNDPRVVTMIITSPANLAGGSNGAPIPVIALAAFYVTGYDGGSGNGTGCQNDPYPGQGSDKFQIWGHWIKYIVPSGSGSGSGILCDFNAFGNCITSLTR